MPPARSAARWLLPALSTLGLLIAAETVLRLRLGPPGPEPIWGEFDAYYSDIYKPFFRLERDRDGNKVYVTNRDRAIPQQFLADKPDGMTRIFVVGGSVAIDFATSQNRIREFLRKALPGRSFEVIGCGMGGYDSFRDSMIQREVLDYQPDAIVLLSGNNEYYQPEETNPTLYKLTHQLRRLWLFRRPLDRWSQTHPQSPPTLQARLANFEANLRLMARRAKQRNVPMIFCTLPADIRDYPPLKSKPRYEDPGYLDALAAVDAGDDRLASQRFESYIRANPSDPFGYYGLAKILDQERSYAEARKQYRLALDLDDPGERCSPSRNDIIRRVAREEGLIVADLERTFDDVAAHRLPDSRIFVDAVHWRGEYYPLVSWTILRSVYDAARAGGSFLAPASRWEWGWIESEKERLIRPMIAADAQKKYTDQAIYKGMTYVLQAYGGISEGALALFELAARRDPARLDARTASFETMPPALEEYPWLRPYEDGFRARWSDISIHVGETYRRRKNERKALAIFDAVLRREPSRVLPRLLRARTLAALGRTREAQADVAAISEDYKRDPAVAYWCRRIGTAPSRVSSARPEATARR